MVAPQSIRNRGNSTSPGRWITLAVMALLVMPTTILAQEAAGEARPAKVLTVSAAEPIIERVYPAIALASNEAEVSFRVSGQVVDLPVRASESVAEGAVLAQLDTRDFQSEIERLESQRDQAVAELSALRTGARPEEISRLEAAVEASQAEVDQARTQFDRTQELVTRGVVPASQLEQQEAALRVAEAQLTSQMEQLAIGMVGGRPEEILAAEAALRGLEVQIEGARDDLEDATLRAPFAGIVARRDIENFTNIDAGQSVALIQNLSTVHVEFDIPGADIIALMANGAGNVTSKVEFDALPDQSFDTELVEFSTQADAATQTYRGRVSVALPDGTVILPGMVARVISTAPATTISAVSVPITALGADVESAPFVWLVDPVANTVSERPVTLGEATGDRVFVLEGLEDGDTVVTAGVSQLMDGMAIRPITGIGE
ncbi:efflux RND transporter periplasmic adaptor subunit [Tropicimonas marinistellae]|uniref:efflux RND transporter periplasmic adaptor subunit n=1 Tax=Tropicimonas marinistellae TaxID=1739787 RepID=UPI00082FC6DA|nr:efflux RND transporter periplasmic adaptor subunit [Tropicimonas marinistellae]